MDAGRQCAHNFPSILTTRQPNKQGRSTFKIKRHDLHIAIVGAPVNQTELCHNCLQVKVMTPNFEKGLLLELRIRTSRKSR